MVTKEQRDSLRRTMAECAELKSMSISTAMRLAVEVPELLDALDEMERELDAEKKIADAAREWVAVHQDKDNAYERVRYDCALGAMLHAAEPDDREDDDQ